MQRQLGPHQAIFFVRALSKVKRRTTKIKKIVFFFWICFFLRAVSVALADCARASYDISVQRLGLHLVMQSRVVSRILATRCMQPTFTFQATTLRTLKPVSSLDLWLDPVAALYPKFLFEALDDSTVLAPARQRLIELFGPEAIVRLRSPAPECFCLDALHVRPNQVQGPQSRAVILCPGANGYYEDSFSSTFIQVLLRHCCICLLVSPAYTDFLLFGPQWVKQHVGDVHIIAANYAGTYRRCCNFISFSLERALVQFDPMLSEGFLHPCTMARSV